MLYQEKADAPVGIDDLLESELVIAHIFRNQPAGLEETVGAGEIRHVNRDVMAVIGPQRLFGLAKDRVFPASLND